MKVEWLDDTFNRAHLIRGFWWFREHCTVHRAGLDRLWFYEDGYPCESVLDHEMDERAWSVVKKLAPKPAATPHWAPLSKHPTFNKEN